MPLDRKVRYGMVGGGPGAFIGAVHRKAAAMDGEIDRVAGAFSSSPEKSREQGAQLFLDPRRVYGSWQEMVTAESRLPLGERIDFVSIVTPNASHFEIARAFPRGGQSGARAFIRSVASGFESIIGCNRSSHCDARCGHTVSAARSSIVIGMAPHRPECRERDA